MKKQKKAAVRLLCALVALATVLTTMPMMTFADTNTAAEAAQSITSEADFLAMDAAGNYKLENDITLNSPYTSDFTGTFDGQGHTVNLNISGTDNYVGMFKNLYGGATVKNVTTAGSVNTSGNYVGGIAGFGNTNSGNILIENCKNTASVTGKKAVGGILGAITSSSNQLTISGCSNEGTVTGTNNQVGGIAGNLENTHVIINCSNTGNVSGFNNYAGIAGRAAKGVSISNCYTTGTVTAYGTSTNAGYAILGSATTSGAATTVTNSYALEGTGSVLAYSAATVTASSYKSASDMQTAEFAALLGDGYVFSNGNYPAHSWEITVAKADVAFTVTPATALITINGQTYTGSATVSLPAGSYSYTISAEGYVSKEGTITVTENESGISASPASVTETLEEDATAYSTVSFTLDPSDATLVVKEGETEVTAQADGTYKLLNEHKYSYKVSKDGYEDETGEFSVEENTTKTVTLKQITSIELGGTYKTEYYVGDEFDTTGLEVTVNYSDGTNKKITEGFTTSGFDSSAVVEEQTITVSFGGKNAAYKISIAKAITFADFFEGLSGITAANNTNDTTTTGYGFVPGKDGTTNVLASNNQGKSSSTAALTVTATSPVLLSFDYKVSAESWGDKFTVNKNGTTLKTEDGDNDWSSYSAVLSTGDTLSLVYKKDYYGNSYDDTVYLKNFAVLPLRVLTFTGLPEGASVELKQNDNTCTANSDGSYILQAGLYTYTITAFGYEDVKGSVVIAGDDVAQAVTMTEKTKYDITFNVVKPDGITADYSVEVKYGDNVLTPDGSIYKLPAGEYSYKITCEGCDEESGTFTVDTAGKAVYAQLSKKLMFADIFANTKERITAADDSTYAFTAVKDETGNYLQSSNKTNYSKSKVTITADKPSKLTFKYMVSESGSYYSSSDYGMLISLNGTQVDAIEEVSTDWKDYSVSLAAGDKLEIAYSCYYNSYAMSSDDENWIRLKDFAVSPLTCVQFSLTPANAEVSVTKDGEIVTAQDGKYLLEAGSYKYTVSAFGYKSVSGAALDIDGSKTEDEITVALEENEKTDITIKVTPADASNVSVTVKNSAGTVMEAQSGLSYSLPKDETYSVSVSADGYITAEKYFTADKTKDVEITLESAGAAWDGSTKTEPEQENGIYLISNAEELGWFANEVKTTPTISGKLTANINLNDKTWTSFGSYDYSDETAGFAGTLDGNGKTISGLNGAGGLVDCLTATGTIKNLRVVGNITASSNVGGIANTSRGTIENCSYSGTLTSSGGYGSEGGIAGRCYAGNVIKNCSSNAAIKNTYSYYGATLNLGGIAGYTYGAIENCYFTGSITADATKTTNKAIGGIAGQLCSNDTASGSITNAYTTATVTGPEAGIGAVIGINNGTVKNVYVLSGAAKNMIADNKGSGIIAEKTQAELKKGLFVYTLGDAFNEDTDLINGGYPVLDWQGGSEPVIPEFEQYVEADKAALSMKDAKRANELAAEKAAVDAEIEAEGGIEALRKLFENDELTIELYYEMAGIDLSDDGTLTPDTENKYQIKKDSELVLPSKGEKGSTITWSSDNSDVIDPTTGKITVPADGKAEVKLTATLTNGTHTDTREFVFVVWSQNAVDEQTLADIKAVAERRGNFIQPLQVYGHTNVKEALEQYLGRKNYEVSLYGSDGIKVEFVAPGTKVIPNDSKTYIDDSGNITYFTGTGTGYGTRNAIYDDVQFKLTLNNVSTTISMRVNIGWDVEYVENMIEEALKDVTWDTIKKDNTNTASEQTVEGWDTTVVDGYVTGELTLPKQLEDNTWLSISWKTKDGSVYYSSDNDDDTYTASIERPAKGEADKTTTLIATGAFNFWDDYTYDAMNSKGSQAEPAEGYKFFQLTIPANDDDQSEAIEAALDKYPTLLTDFVDKTTAVDSTAVTDDIQMPRPSVLEDEGIFTDRYNQKVTMTSSNTDVLEFMGYHAKVYRPLPGKEDATVSYTIKISDRRNNATLAEKTFTMTVKALTQEEIDAAAKQMKSICTEEAYWNGIKGENADKNNVTSSLKPFSEILFGDDGSAEYVRGAVNLTFGGVEVDDLPGYDSMGTQPWREFRSSRNTILTCEQLLLTQPQYNTKVTIDSVLTHSEFGKYWEKFSANPAYAEFEQFYKQPVSVTVTVKGKIDSFDPDENKEINVTVNVDGCGYENFANISGYSFKSTAAEEKTAWDALEECLVENSYTVEGGGSYVSAVTDSNGVKLEEMEHGTYSGWMYTVNGVAPTKALKDLYLSDGDVIRFYYTDGSEVSDEITAAEVEELIDVIPAVEELTLNDAASVSEAETAYNKLTDTQKELIPKEKKTKLEDSVKKMAELKKEAAKKFEDAYKTTGDYLAEQLKGEEGLGSEWVVLGLARADRASDVDVDAYYKSIVEAVESNGSAQLNKNKSTENSRVILALTSIGKDVTDVGGYNLLEPLSNLDFVTKQGTNGAIWALIALDSHDYEIPELKGEGTQTTRENLVQTILDSQLEDGGFAFSGTEADPDMTAMALQALANYKDSNEAVKEAIEKALDCLSNMQDANDGNFMGSDGKSSETCAQVIVALTKLGIDPSSDERFVKDGHSVLDALLGYYVEGGGFEHTAGAGVNSVASEQGYYALASYSRMLSDKTALYDMSDVKIAKNGDTTDDDQNETTDDSNKNNNKDRNNNSNDKNNKKADKNKNVPKSGDENNMSLWIILLAAAVGVGTTAAVSRRKKKEQ